jgi:adenine-specific DNA-methyltransferase
MILILLVWQKKAMLYLKLVKKTKMLIQRVLNLATNENDLVLGSFLGSGTTAAVAQKKFVRRYAGIAMSEHTITRTL